MTSAGREPDTGPDTDAGGDTVVVAETGTGRFTTAADVGRHHLVVDEPAAVGGDDAGPDPYALLLAALGGCTSITVRMYAQRHGWPLERVTVRLRHDRIHAEDCASCETRTGLLDRIRCTVEFAGDLDHAQRRRLLQVAEHCPVHRTLTAEVVIETSSADALS